MMQTIEENERILKIFNNEQTITQTASSNKSKEREVYQGKINLFKLTKNNSTKSLASKSDYKNQSRSNSKDK